ncbi:sigma-70 family RNA polymerase sigma factor [Saccharibacillus sacchari]|uniref:Sigma-70 family RNA polymerase sigma factor n=1 Tax=Saccharibacillus sacchari TaxID=456493 RepID=A0ACC6PI04_9BACL
MRLDDSQSQAISELFEEMEKFLRTYAQSHGKDVFLAEEAVQKTFEMACRKVEKVLASPNPKGWLMNTLKYVISDMNRTSKQTAKKIENIRFEKRSIVFSEPDSLDLDLLYAGLTNQRDYQLIKSVFLSGYSTTEIAKQLGISIEACKKRIQRAKKKIRKRIEQELEDDCASFSETFNSILKYSIARIVLTTFRSGIFVCWY